MADFPAMSTVKEIESAITSLSVEEMQAIRDWLDDFIEDQLEVSDEFKAKIARAKQETFSVETMTHGIRRIGNVAAGRISGLTEEQYRAALA